jgi:4-alpha-glucanotransferase
MKRKAGVVLPLFSIRTRRDWGIGQITDLPACAAFVRRAGHRLLQILPAHELSAGETSPYGALTAFGLDPIYVGVESLEDADLGMVHEVLGEEGRRVLEHARSGPRVQYDAVRALKTKALAAAFERFFASEWAKESPRAKRLARFIEAQRWWLDDLTMYEALRESRGGWGWTTWPAAEQGRHPEALAEVRRKHDRRILEIAYVQWILHEQWEAAHAAMRAAGVELMGDLPFVVGAESADVWARSAQFRMSLSLGAPPDAYSADGQDWGLPPYDWEAMEADGFTWLRGRIRHAAMLYDRFRLDHVVGYFRQWVRPKDGGAKGRFDPGDEHEMEALGRKILGVVAEEVSSTPETGVSEVDPPRAIGEDLGVIPPFVRVALRDLGMPGYRVLPWEKDWEKDVFRDPKELPENAVVSWSTHDTASIVAWWDELPEKDRAALSARTGVKPEMDDAERSLLLLRDLYGARPALALVLAQELLGTRDRINTPATVGDQNWTWRLPRSLEDLLADPRVEERLDAIRGLVLAAGR